jgi:glutathione synthase/RimK-type ligase-like ATP-grasp enzyme
MVHYLLIHSICQVNSSPRFRGLEIAEGIDIAGMIFQYMRMRLGLWRVR